MNGSNAKLISMVLLIACLVCAAGTTGQGASVIWIEAEQFENTGGWVNDSQFVDLMGSPYLLAAGVGKGVDDATTTAHVPAAGRYRLWVRCKDWLVSHSPGQFVVKVGGKVAPVTFGKAKDDAWRWVDAGTFGLEAGDIRICLHDTTGWWGRCDAVVLAGAGFTPSNDPVELVRQREKYAEGSS